MADRYGTSVRVLHPDPKILQVAALLVDVMGGCPTCGDPRELVGLTVKCRDWHEVCQCGARYDQPKGDGCRRRKHLKAES